MNNLTKEEETVIPKLELVFIYRRKQQQHNEEKINDFEK